MTNSEILKIAISQSATDSSCSPDDFTNGKKTVVISKKQDKARAYLELPHYLDITSYGRGIVASTRPELYDIALEYISSYTEYHCFETPNLHVLSQKIRPFGLDICFMAEYWLPSLERLSEHPCDFKLKVLKKGQFENLYKDEWSNALCEKRRHLDMLCIGAYDGDRLVGLSGASADCESMWQIGIDVLPDFRRMGIAKALTARLALEILELGKVPFYCCAWSNVASARNAVSSGFSPAYVQISAKPIEFIRELNVQQYKG